MHKTIQVLIISCLTSILVGCGYGMTPLHYAVDENNLTTVTDLLNDGADVNVANDGGMTPLHYAAYDATNPEIVTALLEAGADINTKDGYGRTFLSEAKENGTLQTLMSDFIQKKYTDELLQAASNGNIAMWLTVETELIKFGESGEDVRDPQGNNSLHLAVQGGHEEFVKTIVQGSFDPSSKNEQGISPIDLAQGDPAILAILTDRLVQMRNDARVDSICNKPAQSLSSLGDCAGYQADGISPTLGIENMVGYGDDTALITGLMGLLSEAADASSEDAYNSCVNRNQQLQLKWQEYNACVQRERAK